MATTSGFVQRIVCGMAGAFFLETNAMVIPMILIRQMSQDQVWRFIARVRPMDPIRDT